MNYQQSTKPVTTTVFVMPRKKGRFVKHETLTYRPDLFGPAYSVVFIRYFGDKAFFVLDGQVKEDYYYKLSR
ncbi:hypothetical protein GCM10028807_09680 [Spirosoma daeguense]